MPGPDRVDSFADELINEADSFADELLAEVEPDPLGTPQEAADYARNEEAARPTQLGGGVPLEQPKEWYDHLSDSIQDTSVYKLAGTENSPLRSLLENTASGALSETADEGQAGMLQPSEAFRNKAHFAPEPEAIPREYAAGSQFEDNRQTLEREAMERSVQNPKSSLVGKIGGGVLQGAALPYGGGASTLANIGKGTASAVGQGAAQLLGSGSGDLENRVDQAQNWVEENPGMTSLAVGLPAAAGAIQKGAGAAAQAMRNKQYANRVAAVTTPQQRTAIAANKGGQQAIVDLGRDIEAQGLHETPWWQFWAPNAETYYNNASKARIAANEAMSEAEDQIVSAGNPQIEVGSIADDLEGSADEVSGMMDQAAAGRDAAFRREQAAGIRGASRRPVETDEGVEATVEGTVPFDQALKNRRYYDQNINYSGRGGYEGAPMQEQVRRQVANQLRRNIGEGLQEAGESGQIDKGLIDTWEQAKKKYSVAAAVEDPALAKMQGDYGGSFGLRDMAAAGVAGLSGPGALVGAKMMQGRMPSVWAGTQSKIAGGLEALESTASPNAAATLTRPVVEENKKLKKEVQEAQRQGGNSWFEDFLSVF